MDLVSIVNVALLSLLNMNNFPYDYNDATIYTPVGTAIGVYDITDELSNYQIYNVINPVYDNISSLNTRRGLPTLKYNCHSYAWHKQKANEREYWLEYESPFYTDGSYVQTSYDYVEPGDRVCYFDSSNTNIHSAIVTRKLSAFGNGTVLSYADLIEIDSKWGEAGLYSGRGDTTPYTSNNGGSASYLRFYHYNYSHSHSYTYTQISGDEEYHTAECSCVFFYQKHSYSFVYINVYSSIGGDEQQYLVPAYKCTKCNYISYIEEYNYV